MKRYFKKERFLKNYTKKNKTFLKYFTETNFLCCSLQLIFVKKITKNKKEEHYHGIVSKGHLEVLVGNIWQCLLTVDPKKTTILLS